MKILKLEFENINAYKKHYVLDFTDPEFDDNNNQFVICGETAAGKTTILDVITLALGSREVRAEVLAVQETVSKNDAAMLYKLL